MGIEVVACFVFRFDRTFVLVGVGSGFMAAGVAFFDLLFVARPSFGVFDFRRPGVSLLVCRCPDIRTFSFSDPERSESYSLVSPNTMLRRAR